ncbi:MAG: hypothetical protein JWP37_1347 [Mucilaginibacter sp.]|nr:hypothetical protein [Mucilaginibacter sp.]
MKKLIIYLKKYFFRMILLIRNVINKNSKKSYQVTEDILFI